MKTMLKGVVVIFGLLYSFTSPQLFAQVGDVSKVRLPGWVPADRVDPQVNSTVRCDSNSGTWTYGYSIGNGANGSQGIAELWLKFDSPSREGVDLRSPPGWAGFIAAGEKLAIPGAFFHARLAQPRGRPEGAPIRRPAQIRPGQALNGFGITSPNPPGLVRAYVRGFAPYPPISVERHGNLYLSLPHDTTNSQRGWVIGPTVYRDVIDFGDGEAGNGEELLGSLSLRDGMTHATPVPIALRLSPDADPATLRASLNDVDVSAFFCRASTDGFDVVALFDLEDSPLQEGQNRLVLEVSGDTRDATTDQDVFTFSVPSGGQGLLRTRPR